LQPRMEFRMKRSVASCFMSRSSVDNKKLSCAVTVLRWGHYALHAHRHTSSIVQ
jgi:hypothetical protein